MPEEKKNASELIFVNTSKPTEFLSPANRKIVRSNATLHRSRARQRTHTPEIETTNTEPPTEDVSPPIGMQLSIFPANMQRHMFTMLAYQERVVAPALFPFKDMSKYHPSHQSMMCLALQDAKVLASTVAIASSWYLNYEIDSQANLKALETAPLKHKQRAIKLVRSTLASASSGNVDSPTAMSITHLAGLELFIGNMAGWQIHRNALKLFSETQNASFVKFSLIEADLIGCYMFDKQPLLYLHSDVDNLSLNRLDLDAPATLTLYNASINSLPHHDEYITLNEEIINVLSQMRALSNLIDQNPPTTNPEAHIRAFLTSRTSIEHTLMRVANQHRTDTISQATCLAAQIYVNKVFRTFEKGAPIPHLIAERLKLPLHMLILSRALTGQDLPELMLWTAVMGGIGSLDGPLRKWFISVIGSICDSMRLTKWRDVYLQLQSWPWCNKYLSSEGEALWLDVEAAGLQPYIS